MWFHFTRRPRPIAGRRPVARLRLEALEDRTLLSIGFTSLGSIREFSVPTQNAVPDVITAGPDGNVWFSEYQGGSIGKITPTGAVTEFPVAAPAPRGILAADGNLWFAEGVGNGPQTSPQIAEMTPNGVVIQTFSLPSGTDPDLTLGPDGNIWFSEYWNSKIGYITPQGQVTQLSTNFPANNIILGPDGDIWFTSAFHGADQNVLGQITPNGVETDYTIPGAGGLLRGLAVANGNLWTCDSANGQIDEINTSGQLVGQWSTPTPDSEPYSIVAGPDGALWFTEENASQIGRITVDGTITEYATPTLDSGPAIITVGPDGNLWFTEENADQIGEVVLSGNQTQPLASPQTAIPGMSQGFDLGGFTDQGVSGPWTVQVNWGDQTTPTSFSVATAGALGTQTHTYASQGAYTVTETITDTQGDSATTQFQVVVGPVVVNTSANGPGSLAQAINEVNTFPSLTDNGTVQAQVTFDIPTTDPGYQSATGTFVIETTGLPGIEEPIDIDGYTQPGASPNTLAVGDDAVIPITVESPVLGDGTACLGDGVGNGTVTGLRIVNFDYFALAMYGPNNVIQGNIITVLGSLGGVAQFGVGLFDGTKNSLVGGTCPADRNVISGYGANVLLFNFSGNPESGGAVVEGNYIGTNAAGAAAASFQPPGDGIDVETDNNTIEGNVISGNLRAAVHFTEDEGSYPGGVLLMGNTIVGNLIGTDAGGTQAVPNGAGIVFDDPATPTTDTTIQGNTIAFNNGPGVWVAGDSANLNPYSTGVRIEGNSIYDNAGMGIDLGDTLDANGNVIPNGVTSNAANDAANHVGGNDLQNYPVLTAASSTDNSVTISGTFNSTPNHTFRLEFFSNTSPAAGDGQTSLGFAQITTDANGNPVSSPDGSAVINPDGSFTVTLPTPGLVGQDYLTATATDVTTGAPEFGDTSEFSPDFTIPAGNQAPVTSQSLQTLIAAAPPTGGSTTVFLQATANSTPATVIQAVNGLTNITQPVTVVLDLGGGTWSTDGIAVNPPPNVNFVIQNGTLDPDTPALTVAGGQVDLVNCTLTTTGNAPTLLVTGGNVTLSNDDVVQASTTSTDPAIDATGGTVNLGTAANPGNNTLSVNSSGNLVSNTSGNAISAAGNTFVIGGTQETAPSLSFPSLMVSAAGGTYNGSAFMATVTVAGVNGIPGSSLEGVSPTLDYVQINADGSTTDLGANAPINAGNYEVIATFAGSADYAASSASTTFAITQAIPTVSVTDAGGTSNGAPFPATATVTGISGTPGSSLEGVSPTLTYYSGSTATGTPLSGAPSEEGTYTVVATFASTDYSFASASTTFIIGQPVSASTSTTLSTSTANAIPGQPVTFTATVGSASDTPTGSLDFFDTTTNTDLGSVTLVNGGATLTTSALSLGNHIITATYTPTGNFLGSSAALTQSVTNSIVVLNQTASGALSLSGNADINTTGNVIVDSSSKTAVTQSGNSDVSAANIDVVGGVQKSGNATDSTKLDTGAAAMSDPLAGLAAPTGGVNQGSVNLSKGTLTINPGVYSSITVSGNATLILNPGVYVIAGGGLTVSGNASISGSGVMIYNAGSGYLSGGGGTYGAITLSGNATVNLTAAGGGPDAGIVIFQARADTQTMSLSGNAVADLNGTAYLPSALVSISGNASLTGALAANELSLSGNASDS